MQRNREPSGAARALLSLAVVVIGASVFLGSAELTVRARYWLTEGSLLGVEATYRDDHRTGLRVPIADKEVGPIRINSLGFRGPEIAVPKPPATIRLAFLGGSTTYSAEASGNDKTWPHLVTASLRQRWDGPVDFDYVNAGVPGYLVQSSHNNLVQRIGELGPDVVVIYHAMNDLVRNSHNYAVRQGLIEPQNADEPSWFARQSMFWYLVEKNIRVFTRSSFEPERRLESYPWAISKSFREDLTTLVNAAREMSEVVVLVTFSHRLHGEQSTEALREAATVVRYHMPYMSIDAIRDGFHAYNQVIRAVAKRTAALLVEGEELIPPDAEHFADAVHFTDAGASAMAARVSGAMLASERLHEMVAARRLEADKAFTGVPARVGAYPVRASVAKRDLPARAPN